VYGDDTADAKLHFATELVASVVLRTATPEGSELTNEQIDALIHGVFDECHRRLAARGELGPCGNRGVPRTSIPVGVDAMMPFMSYASARVPPV
jgi:hypothetical protein